MATVLRKSGELKNVEMVREKSRNLRKKDESQEKVRGNFERFP